MGIGGPQPAEVERMLAGAQATLKADKSWMLGTRGKLKEADAKLERRIRECRYVGILVLPPRGGPTRRLFSRIGRG